MKLDLSKKLISSMVSISLLSCTSLMMATDAFAAENQPSTEYEGGTGGNTTAINVISKYDGTSENDLVTNNDEDAKTNFKVQVPVAINYVVDKQGNVTGPTDAKITNHSVYNVHISNIKVTQTENTEIVPIDNIGNDKISLSITPGNGTADELANYNSENGAQPVNKTEWNIASNVNNGTGTSLMLNNLSGKIGGFDKLDPLTKTEIGSIVWTAHPGFATDESDVDGNYIVKSVNKGFETMNEAFNAAGNIDTVIVNNAEISETGDQITLNGAKNIKLAGEGNINLEPSVNDSNINIDGNSILTINQASEFDTANVNMNIETDNKSFKSKTMFMIKEGSKLNLHGGVFKNNSGIVLYNEGQTIQYGGKLSGGYDNTLINANNGEFTIESGYIMREKYTSNMDDYMSVLIAHDSTNPMYINGGAISTGKGTCLETYNTGHVYFGNADKEYDQTNPTFENQGTEVIKPSAEKFHFLNGSLLSTSSDGGDTKNNWNQNVRDGYEMVSSINKLEDGKYHVYLQPIS